MIGRTVFLHRVSRLALAILLGGVVGIDANDTHAASTPDQAKLLYQCDNLQEKSPKSSVGVKLYQGYDGWFFRKSALENLFEIPMASRNAFARVNDALAHKGIQLVLLPMLPRGIAGQKFIPNGGLLSDMVYDAEFSAHQFSAYIDSLKSLGIEVVDITDLQVRDENYDWDGYTFKQDIHWTPGGSRLVAEMVAEKLDSLLPENASPIQFETTKNSEASPIDGGLTRALNEVCQARLPVEEIFTYHTKRVLNSLDSLFADESDEAPEEWVHIVGTSFIDEKKKYNFAGFLREFLERDVSNFAVAGGGLTESIYGWAQNPNGIGAKPKVLLWEYSNHRDVLEKANYINNAVVPAIFGKCSGDLVVAEDQFSPRTGLELKLPPQEGSPGDYYVRFEFSNPALTEFQLKFAYAAGRAIRTNFQNPKRVTGLMEFYQALPADEEEFPETFDIQFGNGLSASGSVQLCRFPPNVFSSRTISN